MDMSHKRISHFVDGHHGLPIIHIKLPNINCDAYALSLVCYKAHAGM